VLISENAQRLKMSQPKPTHMTNHVVCGKRATDGKERVMTDRERIEVLERRVDFLEESLKETLKQANRIADLLIKGTKKHEPQPQTDCAWR